MNRRTVNYGLTATILAAVAAVYLTSLPGVYLFDDFSAIFRNVNVVGPRYVLWGHRWFVDLTFRLNLLLAGESPLYFHVVNIIVHAANALLVFGVVRRILMRLKPTPGWIIDKDLLAWAVALVWGVHPLNTQAVTYVCQRYESMTALCMLGSFYLFIRGIESRGSQRRLLNGSLAVLFLGMGCKESMAVVPVVLLAYDYCFGAKSVHELTRSRGMFHVASFMMLLVLLMYQVQLAAAQVSGLHAGTRVGELGPLAYLYNQGMVILHYTRLAVWPDNLCFDYMWQPASVSSVGILALILHALLLVLSCIGLFRKRIWGFAGLLFYILLAPTSSVVPIADLAVEHRMYGPLIPLIAMLVTALNAGTVMVSLSGLLRTSKTMLLFVVCVIAMAAALGMRTSTRNMYYWSECAMWQDVCTTRPDNLRARNDLAAALSEKGSIDEALTEYYEVIGRIPEDIKRKCDAGESVVTGKFDKSSPEYAYFVACANIGTMYCNEKRDYDSAFDWYLRALRIAPFHEQVRSSAKNILRAVSDSEMRLDELLDDAIRSSLEEQRK